MTKENYKGDKSPLLPQKTDSLRRFPRLSSRGAIEVAISLLHLLNCLGKEKRDCHFLSATAMSLLLSVIPEWSYQESKLFKDKNIWDSR